LPNRISSVGHIQITTVVFPSVFEIGDSVQITPVNRVIAVQRQRAVFFQNEFNFPDYDIFFRPIVQAVPNEQFRMTTINESNEISVQNLELFSISAASVVHIGSSEALRADSRIKNVRHLLQELP